MSGNDGQNGGRTLAEIENDLHRAEEAFADADARYKKAQQDRRAALNTIDKHQVELDECILELRQRSVPGTKWRQELGEVYETLELHSEDIVSEGSRSAGAEPGLTSDSTRKALGKDFDRLRATTNLGSDDPVLKVVAGPRG